MGLQHHRGGGWDLPMFGGDWCDSQPQKYLEISENLGHG
jgi:hypothetical protein